MFEQADYALNSASATAVGGSAPAGDPSSYRPLARRSAVCAGGGPSPQMGTLGGLVGADPAGHRNGRRVRRGADGRGGAGTWLRTGRTRCGLSWKSTRRGRKGHSTCLPRLTVVYVVLWILPMIWKKAAQDSIHVPLNLVFLVLLLTGNLLLANAAHQGGLLVHKFGVRSPLGDETAEVESGEAEGGDAESESSAGGGGGARVDVRRSSPGQGRNGRTGAGRAGGDRAPARPAEPVTLTLAEPEMSARCVGEFRCADLRVLLLRLPRRLQFLCASREHDQASEMPSLRASETRTQGLAVRGLARGQEGRGTRPGRRTG